MSESIVFDWLQTIRIELSLAGLNMILSPPILNYSPGCNIREGKKEQWHVNSSQAAKHAFFCLYYFDSLRVICIKTLLGVPKILCSSLSIFLFNFFSISLTHFILVRLRSIHYQPLSACREPSSRASCLLYNMATQPKLFKSSGMAEWLRRWFSVLSASFSPRCFEGPVFRHLLRIFCLMRKSIRSIIQLFWLTQSIMLIIYS